MKFKNRQQETLAFIRMAKQALTDRGLTKREIDEFLAQSKREYRRRLRQEMWTASKFEDFELYIIDHSVDGSPSYTKFYKISAASRELAQEFVNNQIQTIDSIYDCSGQWFTTDIRFAHMKGYGYLIKHTLSMDV